MKEKDNKTIRIYKVRFLDTGKTECYYKLTSLFARHTYEELGCVINTIWNAFYKNTKVYNNKRIEVERVSASIAAKTEDGFYEIN